MMALVAFTVFALALMATCAVFGFTLLPALPRIIALLRDEDVPPRTAIVSQPRLRARVRTTFALPVRPMLRAAA